MIRWFSVFLLLCCLAPASQARTVVLTTMNWEPYYGADLPEQGVIVELTRAAFERVGYRLEVQFLPWARALKSAELGGSDGVLGAYYSEERAERLAFSEPLYAIELVLAKLKERQIPFRSLEDLRPYVIGKTRGSVVSAEFAEATYLKVEESLDQRLMLKRLLAGRIDLMVDARGVLLHLMKGTGEPLTSIDFVHPPLFIHPLHNAFSKAKPDYQEIQLAFNEGLRLIRADGTYLRILQKHGLNGEKESLLFPQASP